MAIASVVTAAAREGQDQITGLVVDTSGAAVAGASVSMEVDGLRFVSTTTGADGRFAIANAPAQAVVLRVGSPGFADATLRVPAASRDELLQIVLHPAGLFETVTVTASRTQEQLATPVASSVLTSAELAMAAAGPVDDILRNTTGFALMRRSSSRIANPSSQGVTLRGLAGNAGSRTLVLADGWPLNDPFGGWVYWNRVPEAAIDRIEVVRGATGDLYGGDAIGGVIQVLTFSPARPRVRATVDAGSAGTARISAFGGGQRDGWNARVAGEWVRTDGHPIVAPGERGPVDVRASSNYRTSFGSFGYDRGTWRAHSRLSAYQEARSNGTPLVTNDTNWRLFSGDASGQLAGGLWSVQASIGRQRYFNNFSAVPADRQTERVTSEQRVPSRFTSGMAQWTRPWRANVFLVGAEAKQIDAAVDEIRYSTTNAPSGPFVTGGTERGSSVYGRASLVSAGTVTIVAGVRGDLWRSDPRESDAPAHDASFFSPRLSAAWRANPTIALRASAAIAYRTPTLDELHRSSRVGNTLITSNPRLNPERLTGLDAGVLVTRGRVSARATAFWNGLTNAITNITVSSAPALVTQQKQNADNVRAKGLELEADVRPLTSLTLRGGATLTSSRFRKERQKPALEGNDVPQIPMFVPNASVMWTNPRVLTLSAQLRGSSRQFEDDLNTLPLDPYAVVDISGSRAITRALQIYAASENVFDTEYQTGRLGNPPVTRIGWPRTFRMGVRVAVP